MKIANIDIQNFRKLKSVRISLSPDQTVFVGANNSGKTSALDAMRFFLDVNGEPLRVTDFSVCNWDDLNQLAEDWVGRTGLDARDQILGDMSAFMPFLDVWVGVEKSEMGLAGDLIPTLGWNGELVGVRVAFEPQDGGKMMEDFAEKRGKSDRLVKLDDLESKPKHLWPVDFHDYLAKNIGKWFGYSCYLLDVARHGEVSQSRPVSADKKSRKDAIGRIFRVAHIPSQRGLSDSSGGKGEAQRGLTAQLRDYYKNNLAPDDSPTAGDLKILKATEQAQEAFDHHLVEGFKPAFAELGQMNYPGYRNPELQFATELKVLKGMDGDAVVRYELPGVKNEWRGGPGFLPEKHIGLGYQNLIYMVFDLISFRDKWRRIGGSGADSEIEPILLVLVEEPEAYLHPQAQQSFVRSAIDRLNAGSETGHAHLVISSHASHIAHDVDFADIRYFKRDVGTANGAMEASMVESMDSLFSSDDENKRFAQRYIKLHHCDMFFADAVILVEGVAEKILIPAFIEHQLPDLHRRYISVLEIGGSHAFRLKKLVEKLGVATLVITDIDSVGCHDRKKCLPSDENAKTSNSTLIKWLAPDLPCVGHMLDMSADEKCRENVRFAFQIAEEVTVGGQPVKVCPRTFEDALVLANLELIARGKWGGGLLKKIAEVVKDPADVDHLHCKIDHCLSSGGKSEMALDLLCMDGDEFKDLNMPRYIREGLEWLRCQIEEVRDGDC